MSALPNTTPSSIRIQRLLAAHVPHVQIPKMPAIGKGVPPIRPMRADGGGIQDSPLSPFVGPIMASGGGRTDDVPMHVPSGAYVIPADIVSHIGEGNSIAGLRLLSLMFGAPWGAKGGPWGSAMADKPKGGGVKMPAPRKPNVSGFPQYNIYAGGPGQKPLSSYGPALEQTAPAMRAHGGASEEGESGKPVPIMASGGEFVIDPHEVARRGDGDIAKGHAILDHWVVSQRKHAIKTLSKLPGPVK